MPALRHAAAVLVIGAALAVALTWVWLNLGFQRAPFDLAAQVSVVTWVSLPTLLGVAFLIGFVLSDRPAWQIAIQLAVVICAFYLTTVAPLGVGDAQAGLAFLWLPIAGSAAVLLVSVALMIVPARDTKERI